MASRKQLRGLDVYFNDPRTPGVGEDPADGVSSAVEGVSAARDLGAAQAPDGSLARLAVASLRFYVDQQPRDMLPEEAWADLVAAGRNSPEGALESLRSVVVTPPGAGREPRPSSRRVLEHVEELAESIRSEGVLVPLVVIRRSDELVVLDGHCRAMACVVAGVAEVPARVETRVAGGDETDLADAAHRFILNWTQKRLSPLEAAREVQRITDIATRVVRAQRDRSGETADALASLPASDDAASWVAEAGVDLLPSERLRPGQTRTQEIEATVRKLVLARTGLPLSQYYVLRQLGNLHPDAWETADGLSEGHLRAVVAAPRHLHRLLVDLVQAAQASVKEAKAYARAAREQGEEYLQQRLKELHRRHEEPLRHRTAVSWEPLLRAIPDDVTPRLSAFYAELEALDGERRAIRLRSVARQVPLLEELLRAYREVLDRYGFLPEESDARHSG